MSFSYLFLLLLHLSLTCFCLKSCFGRDTITSTEFIKDPSTILSNNSFFELGFFSPINTTNRYVGIQLKKGSAPTVVWVANRDQPLKDSSGVFSISKNGNLVVLDGDSNILWSSNVSKSLMNSTAQLSDSGNLVLKDSASGVIIWESFKHPSDIFLPEMKFITNIRTEEKVGLTSWNSPSDPSKGSFFFGIDARNFAEAYIWNGNNIHWRSGPWNSQSFIGIPYMDAIYLYGFNLVIENQTYFLSLANRNELSQYETYHLNSQGNVVQSYWDSSANDWKVRWSALKTKCDFYGACGEFGICNSKMSPVCSCLKGFRPKIDVEWDRGNWTNGCVRKTLLLCENSNNVSDENGKGDGFFKMETVNLPHFAEWSRSSASTEDCRLRCSDNCSCSAYAYENGIGCMLWRGSLIDIRVFDVGGGTLYLRLTHSEFGDTVRDMKGIVIASTIGGILIIIVIACFAWRRMIRQKAKKGRNKKMSLFKERGKFFSLTTNLRIGDNLNKELHTYDFEQLAIATNNFHLDNKLGKGGFGPVYKGTLLDGQEIAVKRLSRASNQGHEEFINEVVLISKLQHRNLVRLLGCCVEGEEKMLIYEYMPNLSLDAFIFDSSKQKILDWRKRFDIIMGIARGLLYLHRDSRLKIIHRDLKTSNVLLDKDFNPKISDFGMARIFGNNEDQANTLRVVGTYGYMSPEYAMEGRFSEKSDVFSFGVLLLEIISGRKNSSFYQHEHVLSLVGLAWKLWNEDNLLSLIDQAIYESCNQIEVLRCIHISLLCVQEVMNDRPNVSIIISMLGSEIADLPPPKQPGFTSMQFESDANLSHESQGKNSANIVTITKIEGR